MAKRKKNESIADLRKRESEKEILDTTAGEMILDTNVSEEGRTIEGVLNLTLDGIRNDMTFSFRTNSKILDHIKQVARDVSSKEKKDVNYQKLMVSTFLDVYPMEK